MSDDWKAVYDHEGFLETVVIMAPHFPNLPEGVTAIVLGIEVENQEYLDTKQDRLTDPKATACRNLGRIAALRAFNYIPHTLAPVESATTKYTGVPGKSFFV